MLNDSFDEAIPIYWGPGQLTNPAGYTPPDPTAWRGTEPLNIPIVIRFLHASQSTYDSDSYQDDGGGPTDPPYYEIIEILDHVEPFPSDFVIKVRYDNLIESVYSTPQFFYDWVNDVYVNVGVNFEVGMKYRVVYPSSARLVYILYGTSGDGFYSGSTGAFVVPF